MLASPEADVAEAIAHLEGCKAKVDALADKVQQYQRFQQVLKVHLFDTEELDEVAADLGHKLRLWRAMSAWQGQMEVWMESPYDSLAPAKLEREVGAYWTALQACMEGLPGNQAALKFRGLVEEFQLTIPVMADLQCAALHERHWAAIHAALGFEIKGVDGLTLGELVDKHAMKAAATISSVTAQATHEEALMLMLEDVRRAWDATSFELALHRNHKDAFVLANLDAVRGRLDDSDVTVHAVLSSQYVGAIREDVEGWRETLRLFRETLDAWARLQASWQQLDAIFANSDVRKALSAEEKAFGAVDGFWKELMRRTVEDPHCIRAGTVPGLAELLAQHNGAMDRIQSALVLFLEQKRAAFPRFFLLADSELLDALALAGAAEPASMQGAVRQCFASVDALEFGDNMAASIVQALMSLEGERIALGPNLKARGALEDWLGLLEDHVRKALYKAMKVAVAEYGASAAYHQWALQHPAQCAATAAQVAWVAATEGAIASDDAHLAMRALSHQKVQQLVMLTQLLHGDSLTRAQRCAVTGLLTVDVHCRDVLESLVAARVSAPSAFAWRAQLRFVWDLETDDLVARQADAEIAYGYEYVGAAPRLIVTPLTDRCRLALTAAFAAHAGAALAGASGTGKSCAPRDLATVLGLPYLAYSCAAPGFDHRAVARALGGVCPLGAWLCLEDADALAPAELSVVLEQLGAVQRAARARPRRPSSTRASCRCASTSSSQRSGARRGANWPGRVRVRPRARRSRRASGLSRCSRLTWRTSARSR